MLIMFEDVLRTYAHAKYAATPLALFPFVHYHVLIDFLHLVFRRRICGDLMARLIPTVDRTVRDHTFNDRVSKLLQTVFG